MILFLLLSTGCETILGDTLALPTAMPGVIVDNGEMQTPMSRQANNPINLGSTSTPALWATSLPPTPLPQARQVSHDLTGKNDCLYCHRGPTYYKMPADHAVRTNQTCLGCHSPASGPPRSAPHPLAGRENCLLCHLIGKNGAHVVPGDHSGRLNDTCTTCHAIK